MGANYQAPFGTKNYRGSTAPHASNKKTRGTSNTPSIHSRTSAPHTSPIATSPPTSAPPTSTALLLAGCSSSSPGIPEIYLINFFYKQYTPVYDPSQVDPGVTSAIRTIVGSARLAPLPIRAIARRRFIIVIVIGPFEPSG